MVAEVAIIVTRTISLPKPSTKMNNALRGACATQCTQRRFSISKSRGDGDWRSQAGAANCLTCFFAEARYLAATSATVGEFNDASAPPIAQVARPN